MYDCFSLLCKRLNLTYRQSQVLFLWINGYLEKEIAAKIGCTEKAIRCLFQSIKRVVSNI